MTIREIKFGTTSSVDAASKGIAYSDAETWGALKQAEQRIGDLSIGMKALAKTASGESLVLTSDSDTLPEGNFSLWFVAEKNNSGL